MTSVLSIDEKIKLLRLNSFLGIASPAFLAEVAATALEASFDAGEFIFAKNDAACEFYVLIEGTIGHPEIRNSCVELTGVSQVSTAGQIFGFAALVPGQPARVASALCETATRVLRVDGQWFQKRCEALGPNGHALLQELIRTHAGYERSTLGRLGWVSVRNAGRTFGAGVQDSGAIADCSLEIRAGECCALVSTQGSGLSTLVDVIACRQRLTSGAIYLDGDLVNWPGATAKASADWVTVSSHTVLQPRLTVRENLVRAIRPRNANDDGRAAASADSLLDRFHLSGIAAWLPGELLPSTVRCIQILQGLLRFPRVMIIDDPCAGLDEHGRDIVHAFLLELLRFERDKTILLTTVNVDEAHRWADRVLILTVPSGQIVPHVAIGLPSSEILNARCSPYPPLVRAPLSAAPLPHPTWGTTTALPPRSLAAVRSPCAAGSSERLAVPKATNNTIRESLRNGRFFWTIEFIPSVDKVLRDELHKLGGLSDAMRLDPILAGFTVTDRVHSDRDPDPVAAGSQLLLHSGRQPIVHFSGKDRDVDDLAEALDRMELNGLENMLVVTGDRLKEQPRGRRVRYLESVSAIQVAKRLKPAMLIAAVVNPFKYREEDAMAQYLKLGKKVAAGADLIVTQIGFDILKYEEAAFWVNARNYRVPLVANVMPMTAARARYIRRNQLAGVTVTDSFLALLEAEERMLSDKGASRVSRRLALQIIGLRQCGYAGVQLTGIHSPEKLAMLHEQVASLTDLCADKPSWAKAWEESFTLPEQGRADPAPANSPWYLASDRPRHATRTERWKYRLMDRVHGFVFGDGFAAAMAGRVLRGVVPNTVPDALLVGLERIVKSRVFGCETCGSCRLAATQYVCPETCPKGLANGACGGTTDNLCEFRDRECIHSVKYRIAKDAGVLADLEDYLIPPVGRNTRNTSSWPRHFRGEASPIRVTRSAKLVPDKLTSLGMAGIVAESSTGTPPQLAEYHV